MSDVKKATAVINYRMQEVDRQLESGQTVQPYSAKEAVLDPTLVPEEVPFKETPKVKVDDKEEVAAMGVPPKKTGFREVDVMSLFGALQRDGEAKLSDHYVDERKETKSEARADNEDAALTKGFRR